MSDYKKRFEEWQREAKERFDDFDKQIGLKEKISESAKVVSETAQKGAESIRGGAEKIKKEAEKTEVGKQAVKVAEETIKTAEKVAGETVKTAGETAKKAWKASEPMREAADDAGEKAGDVFENAAKNTGEVLRTVGEKASEVFGYAGEKAGEAFVEARKSAGETAERISKAFNLGASWSRTFNSAFKTIQNTAEWVAEKPLQAASTGASLAVGAGLGVVFTGVSSHWFFSSFIPTSAVKKISEEFNKYLKSREDLIAKGELNKAEAEKIRFEREIVKYVGAPLLGAFSFASGAVLMTNVFNPKTVTGAPVSWFLMGNPVLEGAWYFGNGLFCLKTGYDFFMISLEDDREIQTIVKELKGLLPSAEPA